MARKILLVIVLLLLNSNISFAYNWCTSDAAVETCHTMDVDEDPLQDKSSNNEDIDLKGAGEPNFVSGKFNGGYEFDGSDDYASTASAIDLTGTSVGTIVYYMNWDTFANDDDLAMESSANFNLNTNSYLNDPNSSSPANEYVIGLRGSGSQITFGGFTRPSADAFHHYAILLDITNNNDPEGINVYVDGVDINFVADSSAADTGTLGDHVWYLMSRGNSSLFGDSILDEFAIFSDTKDSTDINSIMDNGLEGDQGGAVTRRVILIM